MKCKPIDSQDGIDLDHTNIENNFRRFQLYNTHLSTQDRLHGFINILQADIKTGLRPENLDGFQNYSHYKQLSIMATEGLRPHLKPDFVPNKGYGDFRRESQRVRLQHTIAQHIRKLQDAGRCWVVPLSLIQNVEGVHLSALHVASKAGDRKGRPCCDLSHSGLNDGTDMEAISKELGNFELPQLKTVARVLHAAQVQGNTMLHKTDVTSAFNCMFLSPAAALLQVSQFGSLAIIPLVAGFGWCAAPAYYNVIASAIHWAHTGGISDACLDTWTFVQGRVLSSRNTIKQDRSFTYVDDSCGQSSETCVHGDMSDLQTIISQLLGPSAYNINKTEGPLHTINNIGWECTTDSYTITPGAKGRCKMYYWVFRGLQAETAVSLQDLQSAVSTLRWYSAVIPMASTVELQRCLVSTQRRHNSKHKSNAFTYCTLTSAAMQELNWWRWLLAVNLTTPTMTAPAWYLANDLGDREHVHAYTDASTEVGGGYIIPGHTYGQFLWSPAEQLLYGRDNKKTDINGLEFVTAVCAVIANREWLRGKVLHLHGDNIAAVSWINKRRTNQLFGQSWMRILVSIALHYDILLVSEHIPGVDNVHADALSRYMQNKDTKTLIALLQRTPMLSAASRQHIWSMSSTPRLPMDYGWAPPYFTGEDPLTDLLRLLVTLHTLGHVKGLARGTVADYFTSTKHHYTVTRGFLDKVSSIWGTKGITHPLLTQMLKSIPERHRPERKLLTPDWIKDGFEHCWTTTEYVAIAFLLGWLLRVGEGCDTEYPHILTWSMVTFSQLDGDSWHPLPWHLLRLVPCDMVDLLPHSRKYQPQPRRIPGRVNICRLANPADGITKWTNLCMASLLQGWAIANHVDTMTTDERQLRPILAVPGTNTTPTRDDISRALKRHARHRHEDPDTVVPHCLRKTGITQLANSALAADTDTYLRAVGHHSISSSAPYVIPSARTAANVTHALQPPTR